MKKAYRREQADHLPDGRLARWTGRSCHTTS